MIKVLAYNKDSESRALLGSGYVVIREDGKYYLPILYDLLGNPLPEDWYHLEATDDIRECYVPRNIQ